MTTKFKNGHESGPTQDQRKLRHVRFQLIAQAHEHIAELFLALVEVRQLGTHRDGGTERWFI